MPASSPHNETFMPTTSRFLCVAGAVAGDVTVTGIKSYDVLKSVLRIDNGNEADLTSEFSISATDTINNTGGTASNGGTLLVIWDSVPTEIGG